MAESKQNVADYSLHRCLVIGEEEQRTAGESSRKFSILGEGRGMMYTNHPCYRHGLLQMARSPGVD